MYDKIHYNKKKEKRKSVLLSNQMYHMEMINLNHF